MEIHKYLSFFKRAYVCVLMHVFNHTLQTQFFLLILQCAFTRLSVACARL